MNIFLLSIIDKRIGRVMTRLSQLRHFQFFLDAGHHEILLGQAKTVIDTYVRFFSCIHILPVDFTYEEPTIIQKFDIAEVSVQEAEGLNKKLLGLIMEPISTGTIPVSIHMSKNGKIILYLGIGIIDGLEKAATFYLQEISILTSSFVYSYHTRAYLEDAIYSDGISKVSPRLLASKYGKNYNQFQQDCKEYFGDTFHQFHNKLRMMDVLEDIVFTRYSYKEIAYRHDFSGYNSIYILFHKKYNFPLDSIPRLKTENQ